MPKERKRKAQAEGAQGGSAGAALVGKRIEVYWDGEDAWFEAEVLSYDRLRYHLVRYAADAQEIDEDLLGQPDSWRHVVVAAATATPAAVGIGELQDRVHTVGRAW